MKVEFHLPSALLGAGVLALIGVAVAAQGPIKREVVQIPAPAVALGPGPIEVEGIPAPKDIVQFDNTSPYTVPLDKRLVIRDIGMLGQEGGANAAGIWIDGVWTWTSDWPSQLDGTLTDHFAVGVRAEPGSVVTITYSPSGNPDLRVYLAGYLSDI